MMMIMIMMMMMMMMIMMIMILWICEIRDNFLKIWYFVNNCLIKVRI